MLTIAAEVISFETVNCILINKYLRVVYVLRRQPILCLDPNHL